MKENILRKEYESEEIKKKLDVHWKGLRQILTKNNAKKVVDKFDDEIMDWLAIGPAIELLKELELFEAFEEITSEFRDLADVRSYLEDFLNIGLRDEFPVNQRLKNLKGNIGPFEVEVPETSRELFEMGLKLKNCLSKMHQIRAYQDNEMFIALSLAGTPIYGIAFQEMNGYVKCIEARRASNDKIEPHEYFLVVEAEDLVAKKLKAMTFRKFEFDESESAEALLRQFERMII